LIFDCFIVVVIFVVIVVIVDGNENEWGKRVLFLFFGNEIVKGK